VHACNDQLVRVYQLMRVCLLREHVRGKELPDELLGVLQVVVDKYIVPVALLILVGEFVLGGCQALSDRLAVGVATSLVKQARRVRWVQVYAVSEKEYTY
jgi:hypothetical protein